MATKICQKCGAEFEGIRDQFYCAKCAKQLKSDVIRTRICKMCGVEFEGGPRAMYCPTCGKERRKESNKAYKRKGTTRPIGSVDKCQWCGAEYIVTSGRQKFCSEKCSHEALLEWQKEHKKGYNKASGQDQKKAERRRNRIKVCEYCGKTFQTHKSTNLCSDYCRKKQLQISQCKTDLKRGKNRNIQKLLEESEKYRRAKNENL